MNKYYYLATNTWGHGRAIESGNGWSVTAYKSEETRDKIYDELSYTITGCFIPSLSEVAEIFGTTQWGICEGIQYDDGGFECGVCED